jgi:hypothetical protein
VRNDAQFRQLLVECRFESRGMRPGFVPFSAPCIAARESSAVGISTRGALRELARLAQELGGELVEEEVLWLPEQPFGRLWSSG